MQRLASDLKKLLVEQVFDSNTVKVGHGWIAFFFQDEHMTTRRLSSLVVVAAVRCDVTALLFVYLNCRTIINTHTLNCPFHSYSIFGNCRELRFYFY